MSSIDTRERALVDAVSLDDLKRDNAEIAKDIRLSGSPAEAAAFAYIADRCRSFGMEVHEYAVDAYVSLPGAASLSVVSPKAGDITCITHSFSVATGPEGRTGTLIYVGKGTTTADYAGSERARRDRLGGWFGWAWGGACGRPCRRGRDDLRQS